MSRYTFTCEHFDYNNWSGNEEVVSSKHTTEFRADDLTTMLENFESFLRGAGFNFEGTIDVVPPEEELYYDEDIEQSKERFSHIISDLMYPEVEKEESLVIPPFLRDENCPLCGLSVKLMQKHDCFDVKCPIKTNNAY